MNRKRHLRHRAFFDFFLYAVGIVLFTMLYNRTYSVNPWGFLIMARSEGHSKASERRAGPFSAGVGTV